MKTITLENGERISVTDDEYTKLKRTKQFHIGDWVMIENTGKICTTHSEGHHYSGWEEGSYPDLDYPCQIVDILPLEEQPDAHVVFQFNKPFVFGSPAHFRHASAEEVELYKKTKPHKFSNRRIALNDELEGIISVDGMYIKVDCSTFTFEKVKEIYKRMKKFQKWNI